MAIEATGAIPQISQMSRMRAAAGDGRLSAETLAAVAEGAIPPSVSQAAEQNSQVSDVSPASDTVQPLKDQVDAVTNQPLTTEDVINISKEAQAASAEQTEQLQENVSDTSQNLAETQKKDTLTAALGNTVNIEA